MKNLMMLLAATFLLNAGAAESIAITATPRSPWDGKVDLTFTITGESGTKYDTSFVAKDIVGGTNIAIKTLYMSNGMLTAGNDQLLSGTYNWAWDAAKDCGTGFVCEHIVVEGRIEVSFGGVQLWENGPYWAECNVGATKPEEYGYYFWWGDTVGYKRNANDDGWISVKEGTSYSFGIADSDCKSNSELLTAGYIDATGNLVAAHDAATAHLGARWRMPTDAEFSALISNCDTQWTMRNGVYGLLVKGRSDYASKSIFLPAAGSAGGMLDHLGSVGHYSSSTPDSDDIYDVLSMVFSSSCFYLGGGRRSHGQSVRAVRESAPLLGPSNEFRLDVGVPVDMLTIDWGQGAFVYDGQPKTLNVDVKYGDKALEKETHYAVTYLDNVKDGMAKVIVAGLDPYFGSVTNMFAITAPQCEVKSVTAQQRYPWNGLVDVVVTFDGAPNDVAKHECVFIATNSETKAEIPVEHITRKGDDSGSGTTWTRRFVWDAAADVGAVKIDAAVLTVVAEIPLGGVQLWENGPYWAECNVGASNPEENGYYFWWGDTVGYEYNAKDIGSWDAVDGSKVGLFFDSELCLTYGKNNAQLQALGFIDAEGNLMPIRDAATVHLGAPWRMPTKSEFAALEDNCKVKRTTQNGMKGRLFTGKGAYSSKSIFLPEVGSGYSNGIFSLGWAGCYWSATPNSDHFGCAWRLGFDLTSSDIDLSDDARYYGRPVRPVRGFANVTGASNAFRLDCRTGIPEAQSTESIRYSSAWESDDAGAVAETAVNGVVIKSASGCGVVEWTPTRGGTYTLTHVVKVNDAQVGGTLTARFVVPDLAGEAVLTGRVAIVDGKYVAEASGTDADCEYKVRYALSPKGPFVDELVSDGEIASEFWYEVSADGYLPVTNRVEVCEISAGAFYGRQDLTRVVIPATVTNIGHHAFASCSNLVSVTMGDSVAAVGRYAFAGCPKTVDFDLPTDVSVAGLPKDGSLNQVTTVAAVAHPAWTEDVWDGYMDIDYTVAGAAISGVAAVTVKVVATDGVTTYPVTTVKGDMSASSGSHHLVWDAAADLGEARPKNLSVRVTLEPKNGSDEVIAPLEGDYAADLSLESFRTTFGSRTSQAATIDLAKAVPLRYEVASDGSAIITAGAYTADGRILLPETLDGHAISGIRDGAFPSIGGGATFVLPDSTTAFDTATIAKWAGLKDVTTSIVFPTGVSVSQVAAFRQFQNLTRVVFNGKPDALSDSLLGYLKTSGLEIVYPAEFAAEWESTLARYVTAGVIVLSAETRTDDPTVMDVTYLIGGTVNPVRARTLAFKDNVRSFANVVRPETFADGTEAELGEGMAPDVVHKFSWKVAEDWQINLAKVRMEVLILPDDLLPLKFFTIPANGGHPAMTVSRNALTEQRVLDALLWLYADGDKDLTLADGVLRCGETVLANGTVPNGEQAVAYVFAKMGCRIMTDEELTYVNDVSRLGLKPEGVRQYAVKVEGE